MSENEKIPATVYRIDLTQLNEENFTASIDQIIKTINREGERYKEEKITGIIPKGFQVRIYSAFRIYAPKWRTFLLPMLDANTPLAECENLTNSFICFIGYEDQLFAITGGQGSFAIERYTSENFGLEILVRLFEKNSKVIKSIQDRGVTGIVLGQTKFYRGDQRFSDENQFGKIFKQVKAELSKKILTNTFGFIEADLNRSVSGCQAKSSFQINKAIDFDTLLSLVKRFVDILKLPEKFALNKVNLISKRDSRRAKLLKALNAALVKKIYDDYKAGNVPDVDVCNKEFETYLTASYFFIVIDKDERIELHNPPSLMEIIHELRKADRLLDNDEFQFSGSVLNRALLTDDENKKFLTGGTVLVHIHGEITYEGKTYFIVDGEWYEIHPEFIDDLNKECKELLYQVWEDKLIQEVFDTRKRENIFNMQFIGRSGWLVFDTITPDNIECCDLLQYNPSILHLIHIKKGFDNSIRDLASQVLIAAKRIREDIKTNFSYIEEIELQTKRGIKSDSLVVKQLAGQQFPSGGLKGLFVNRKNKEIYFCLAFADTATSIRSLKDNIASFQSNIAKYSLVELHREILSMGFGFKVIQLNRHQ
jgi:uncharacterized protein (TIGR04141 family)